VANPQGWRNWHFRDPAKYDIDKKPALLKEMQK
jgi:hypothetical protein